MLKSFLKRCLGFAAGLLALSAPAHAALDMLATATKVQITNDVQRISFDKDGDGKFRLTTYVYDGNAWVPFFDARKPLIQGQRFDLEPTSYSILEDTAGRKLVQFQGTDTSPNNVFDIAIEARSDTPLIYFQIASHFASNVSLSSPQPTVALWMNQSTVTMQLDQGPPSATGNVYFVPFNFGCPAAYLWDANREACVFFDMTPMTWFAGTGVYRFYDIQIKTTTQGGQTGLGMIPRHLWGNTLRSGEMLVTFFLYSGWKPGQPDKFQALDRMLSKIEERHPADSVFPQNTLEGGEVSWTQFTQRSLNDMSNNENVTYASVTAPFVDAPLNLVTFNSQFYVHPPMPTANAGEAQAEWAFPTLNHHLAPWVLYTRFNPTPRLLQFARRKKDAIPRFYDPQSKLIASGTRFPDHVFTREISWQTLVYYQEIWQIYQSLDTADFNPAIMGRSLMGAQGLIDLAHNVDYIFPVYYDPFTKQPVVFQEEPGLKDMREPWSVGSYSYVMMRNYHVTQDRRYLEEAKTSMETLLTTMSYTANNDFFTATYNEAMDMPVMELMGNAYGAIAAHQLFQDGLGAQWRQISVDFLNTLLRQTFWHEDNTSVVSTKLRNMGLFIPFVGASTATPWETSEANFALAWLLKNDPQNPRTQLMLKLSNLNRINSFYFYPATYAPEVRALNPNLPQNIGQYFPIEALYVLESPGGSVGPDGPAVYMAGNAMWNWWMYEALAESSDRSIMVLNPDVLEDFNQAVSAAERTLFVFNPTSGTRNFNVLMKSLPAGNYTLTTTDAAGNTSAPVTYTSAALTAGIPLSLGGMQHVKLTLRNAQAPAMLQQIAANGSARDRLSYAYQLLQEHARDNGVTPLATTLSAEFASAMQDYTAANYIAADNKALAIIQQLGFQLQTSAAAWELFK